MDSATEGVKFEGLHIRVGLFEDPELDFTKVLNVFYINVKKKLEFSRFCTFHI